MKITRKISTTSGILLLLIYSFVIGFFLFSYSKTVDDGADFIFRERQGRITDIEKFD